MRSLLRPCGLAAQQVREVRDPLDRYVDLEAQLLGNLSGAALDPKRPQSCRHRGDAIPVVRGDEAKLWIAYLEAFGGEPVDPMAGLENLHFLDADDLVEQIADASALRRCLKHFRLAVGQDGELKSLLLKGLKTGFYIREGCETQIGAHQLLFLVGREVNHQALAGPDETIFSESPEVAMAPHEAPH